MLSLTEALDALLPQTQCTRCGFPACAPYAQAMAAGTATHNLCEPGGSALVPRLAQLLQQAPLALAHAEPVTHVAWIREADCIGCARCLPACPVDAILGARRLSHTVIAADCTGCDLCLPACPVDCIELRPPASDWQPPATDDNRQRFTAHQARLARRHWHTRASALLPAGTAPAAVEADPRQVAAIADAGMPPAGTPGPDDADAALRAQQRAALIANAQAAAAARRRARAQDTPDESTS